MSGHNDLHANPEARDLNGVTLFEGLQALESHERSEGRICNANVIARAFGTLQATAHPNNDTLNNLGAFDRKTKVDKHTSTNWGYLRRMIDRLDAAGQSDVADVLVWQVWWRVNTEARTNEYRRLDADHRAGVERDYHLLCQEERQLRADVQEAVQALFAFTQARWFANTQEKSDDVRRAVEFIKKHDPERWAAHLAEDHPF